MSDPQENSFDVRIVLRPRSTDEVFDLALAYLRVHFRDFRRLFVLLTLSVMALALGIGWWLNGKAAMIFVLVAVTAGERVVTIFTGRHLFNNPVTVTGAIKLAVRRFFSLSFLSVLVPLPLILTILFTDAEEEAWLGLAILAGLIWPFVVAARLHVSEVMYLEQLSWSAATKRTSALTRYRFGREFGFIVLGGLVRALFVVVTWRAALFVAEFVLQFAQIAELIGVWFLLLGYTLSGPYMAVVRFFEYVDARTRQEGWDIQVRFHAISQRERERQARRWAA